MERTPILMTFFLSSGSNPVVCVFTQMVFPEEGWFVRVGFFQGEFLSGNSPLVFQPCFHSGRRTGTAVLSLVNRKVRAPLPARRTHTLTPAGRAAPGGLVHSGGPGSSGLLSYCCAVIHAKVPPLPPTPAMHQQLAFQSPFS